MSDKLIDLALYLQRNTNRERALEHERALTRSLVERVHTVETILRDLRGEDPVDVCRVVDGRIVRMRSADVLTHALITGASGSGKTRQGLHAVMQLVKRAVADLDEGQEAQPLGIELRVLDPKSETVSLLKRSLAELSLFLPEHQRRALAQSVHSVEWRRDRVTPFAALAPSPIVSDEYQCELKKDAMVRASRSAWSESLSFLLYQTLRLLLCLGYPINFRFIENFFRDEPFRRSTLSRVSNTDVRYYFTSFPIARATSDAFVRRIAAELAYPEHRLSIGIPPDRLAPLGLPDSPSIVLADCGASLALPPSIALSRANWHLTDLLLSARSRDPRTPMLILIDEAPVLLAEADATTDLFTESLRVSRSSGVSMLLLSQSLDALPRPVLRNLETNIQWTMAFQSRREVADLLFPHLLADPRDARPEAVRRREFARDLEALGRQDAYFWRKGLPAFRVRSLDVPDPGTRSGRTAEELERIFDTELASRSTISTARAAAIIAAWEAEVVGPDESSVGPSSRPSRPTSLAELLEQTEEEGDE